MIHGDPQQSVFQRKCQQSDAIEAIRKIIGSAIRRCLPYTLMLKEYITNLDILDRAVDVQLISDAKKYVTERVPSNKQRRSEIREPARVTSDRSSDRGDRGDRGDRHRSSAEDPRSEMHTLVERMLAKDDCSKDQVRDMLVLDQVLDTIKSKQESVTLREMAQPSQPPVSVGRVQLGSKTISRKPKILAIPRPPSSANLEPNLCQSELRDPYQDQLTSIRPTREGVKLAEKYQ